MPNILNANHEPLTTEQRQRLSAAVARHRDAVAAYLHADAAPEAGRVVFEAECDLKNLMAALGLRELPDDVDAER
jgi:dsDNA-binding SOS-regulon protein